MVATKRVGLTPSQREVFGRLEARARRPRSTAAAPTHYDWIPLRQIGSRTTLMHLVHKGWAEHRVEHGPRGGVLDEFRPVKR